MPAVALTPADLTPFAPDLNEDLAQLMIDDAVATAAVVAPCIVTDEFAYPEAAKAILRGAILRWHESGTGAMQSKSMTAGPFAQTDTFDTRQVRRGMFWPSEIKDLRKLCNSAGRRAFSIDLAPDAGIAPPPGIVEV